MNVDTKLKLLKGSTFKGKGFELSPLTLGEITELGYTKYINFLAFLTTPPSETLKELDISDNDTLIDVIKMLNDTHLLKFFLEAVSCFFKCTFDDIELTGDDEFRFKGNIINNDNIEEFIHFLRLQNCLKAPKKEKKPKFRSKAEEELWNKIQKGREAVAKAESAKGDVLDFFKIVSSVSTKSHNYNKHSIWNCTMFQFYDEFKRIHKIDGYLFSVLGRIHGSDIEIEEWTS